MRILRGLSSRLLPCGCLTGVYETYSSEIVGIVDVPGGRCADPAHGPGQVLPFEELEALRAGPETLNPRTPSV